MSLSKHDGDMTGTYWCQVPTHGQKTRVNSLKDMEKHGKTMNINHFFRQVPREAHAFSTFFWYVYPVQPSKHGNYDGYM